MRDEAFTNMSITRDIIDSTGLDMLDVALPAVTDVRPTVLNMLDKLANEYSTLDIEEVVLFAKTILSNQYDAIDNIVLLWAEENRASIGAVVVATCFLRGLWTPVSNHLSPEKLNRFLVVACQYDYTNEGHYAFDAFMVDLLDHYKEVPELAQIITPICVRVKERTSNSEISKKMEQLMEDIC